MRQPTVDAGNLSGGGRSGCARGGGGGGGGGGTPQDRTASRPFERQRERQERLASDHRSQITEKSRKSGKERGGKERARGESERGDGDNSRERKKESEREREQNNALPSMGRWAKMGT